MGRHGYAEITDYRVSTHWLLLSIYFSKGDYEKSIIGFFSYITACSLVVNF